ncbi:helix-turn-helix domain-containing protein [Methanospirillum sp. J.3.6.1-F.2.7.3]|uniref:Helix-turn-helix domain-containing protein n=1 Tax=Methanospirillum purgamenti TaxID=2834276 RepID=A0A8E7B0V1_9EURY|nr:MULTISPECIES: helix-turn-helix domain-containing protein [Methanospirillum]MDX8550499.1 helix-turn-helix domain-containing protein [Methanospirillum hungatei]QVV88236.1 helix-turn-helix domain-containing protein [Methanospirillum sp. J.3.6.1-F.2.7.3]
MRKMTITCQISDLFRTFYTARFFEAVKSIELLRMIRLDFKEGTKLGIAKITCNPGFSVKDIEFPEGGEIIAIFQETGDESILLFKGTAPPSIMHISKLFARDIIWSTPTILYKDKITYSIIGEEKELKYMLRLIKLILGPIEDIAYEKATFGPYDLIQSLTKKQQEILVLAKKAGYYHNPRKITLDDLSLLSGLSKATVGEHLRKAENHVMNSVLAGY